MNNSFFKSFLLSGGSKSILEAQLRLAYLMLCANVLKGFIFLYDAHYNHQGSGTVSALLIIAVFIASIFVLRAYPQLLKFGTHLSIILTAVHIYYRTFNDNIVSDVITMQAIFIVMIIGFYGLNAKWGAIYTFLVFIAPILVHYVDWGWPGAPALPEGLNDIYVGINFLVILISTVYFHGALFGSLHEKDRLNQELTIASDSKSVFLSTMAHELRTPLNSVIGIASLLIEDNKDAKQKEPLDILKFSAENLLALINDILDINKLAAGKLELEKVPFNFHALINSVATSMAYLVDEKSLYFKTEIDPEVKMNTYEGDATRMSQVLFNLVGNAVKFTERGGVTVSAKLQNRKNDLHLIRFMVEDTGIGISESQQQVIFDPFVQASTNTTRKFGGTGLGLSIVKQLIGLFGSSIQLESEEGKGTRICFDLWMKVVGAAPAAVPAAKIASEAQLSRLKVLLVEDNLMNIYFMQQLFLRWKIAAKIVENGQEAVDAVKEGDYDLILMDMHMPVMDGLEATRQIRRLADTQKATIHIIALTASVSDEVRDKVIVNGMDDYLAKPFQLDELRSKLLHLAERMI